MVKQSSAEALYTATENRDIILVGKKSTFRQDIEFIFLLNMIMTARSIRELNTMM